MAEGQQAPQWEAPSTISLKLLVRQDGRVIVVIMPQQLQPSRRLMEQQLQPMAGGASSSMLSIQKRAAAAGWVPLPGLIQQSPSTLGAAASSAQTMAGAQGTLSQHQPAASQLSEGSSKGSATASSAASTPALHMAPSQQQPQTAGTEHISTAAGVSPLKRAVSLPSLLPGWSSQLSSLHGAASADDQRHPATTRAAACSGDSVEHQTASVTTAVWPAAQLAAGRPSDVLHALACSAMPCSMRPAGNAAAGPQAAGPQHTAYPSSPAAALAGSQACRICRQQGMSDEAAWYHFKSTTHTEACLREGRRTGHIVCVACGTPTLVILRRPRHHETAGHKQRVAWLKRPPSSGGPPRLPLQQPPPPQQHLLQQQTAPPRMRQQQALLPQLPLPLLVAGRPELAAAAPEPPPITMAEALAAAANAAAAAAEAAAAASDPAGLPGLFAGPSSPAAGQSSLQRGSAKSLGPLGTPASPLAPLIPPSRSFDSAGPLSRLTGLRSLSDEQLNAAAGGVGRSTDSRPALAATTGVRTTAAGLPTNILGWEPQQPQRPAMAAEHPASFGNLPQLLPGCQAQGGISRGGGGAPSTGGAPAAHERAASQHRFLSQLQQQGLQHQLDGAVQGMQLT